MQYSQHTRLRHTLSRSGNKLSSPAPIPASGNSTRNGWQRVSKSEPCPVCNGPDNCSVSSDRNAVWCGRQDAGSLRQNAGGQWLHIVGQSDSPRPVIQPASDSIAAAGPELRDRVYVSLIAILDLEDRHRQDLLDRGMSAATIASGMYRSLPASGRGHLVRQLLKVFDSETLETIPGFRWKNGRLILGGAAGLLIPVRNIDGQYVACRLRPNDPAGGGKYRWLSSPGDGPSSGVHCHVAGDLETICDETEIRITEGEIKAEIAYQETGIPTVSIAGVGSWHAGLDLIQTITKRDHEASGEWRSRLVLVALDNDWRQNAAVENALRNLVLGAADRHAPMVETWPAEFKGIDDCLAGGGAIERLGPAESAAFIGLDPDEDPPEYKPLEAWRAEITRSRLEAVNEPGVYLDRSPTGAGKSWSEGRAMAAASGRGVLIVPTHQNAREAIFGLEDHGLSAVAFPELTAENCGNFEAAETARELGLQVVQTACVSCPLQTKMNCRRSGWTAERDAARDAEIQVMTHQRAAIVGLAEVSPAGAYVAVHESPLAVLRPQVVVERLDLQRLRVGLSDMLDDPRWLNSKAEDHDECHEFLQDMLGQAEYLCQAMAAIGESGSSGTEVEPVKRVTLPAGIPLKAFQRLAGQAGGGVLRVLIAHMAGDLGTLVVFRNRITATWHNQPNENATTVISDATVRAEDIEAVIDQPILDMTPDGLVEPKHQVWQITTDINRQTAGSKVRAVIRGFLVENSSVRRLGLICHSNHVAEIEKLEPQFRQRISKIEYFGGGQDRASNAWIRECDHVALLGTSRLPQDAFRDYLVRIGDYEAADLDPDWITLPWPGQSLRDGRTVVIQGRGYADHRWQDAACALVRSAMRQAIGRGRPILDTGVPVVVFSNEDLGMPVDDLGCTLITDRCGLALSALGDETRSTAEVAEDLGKADRTTRETLAVLEAAGLVRRLGGGCTTRWQAVPDSDQPAEFSKRVYLGFSADSDGRILACRTTDRQIRDEDLEIAPDETPGGAIEPQAGGL